MDSSHLSPDERDAIMKTATILYESQGFSAVRALANQLDWKEFDWCRPCNSALPFVDRVCMVCGSVNTNAMLGLPQYLQVALTEYSNASYELGHWVPDDTTLVYGEDEVHYERLQQTCRKTEEALVDAIMRYRAGAELSASNLHRGN